MSTKNDIKIVALTKAASRQPTADSQPAMTAIISASVSMCVCVRVTIIEKEESRQQQNKKQVKGASAQLSRALDTLSRKFERQINKYYYKYKSYIKNTYI